ncbi:MAG: hypothetical protein ACT4PO_03510 [Actinomycetota bacterium]
MARFLRILRTHVRAFFTNWRTFDAPLVTKLRLGVRNRVRATFSHRQCCGHPGEPGC